MNLLARLLNWPPDRSTIAVLLVVTRFSVGTLALLCGVSDDDKSENITVLSESTFWQLQSLTIKGK